MTMLVQYRTYTHTRHVMPCISLEMIHVHLFVMFVDARTLHFISHVIECPFRRFSVMYIMNASVY